ncbi:MAG: dihydropteroate synthase [Rickettsiales bacterium]
MNRPALVGIVNITPDSFSGDGKMARDAVQYAEILLNEGADIIDLGAESTRPGASLLSFEEEWARLGPVLEGIANQNWRMRTRLSIDTRHSQTAARALELGVDIINDVSSFADPAMIEMLEEHECDIIVMHNLSIPADPAHTLPPDCDMVAEILRWKASVTTKAQDRGIGKERLIYDPGIGFGKSAEQSLALIEAAPKLVASGGRWLYGHSRKSFLKKVTDALDRDDATLEISVELAVAGVDYLRVHNIRRHVVLFDK